MGFGERALKSLHLNAAHSALMQKMGIQENQT
jgi:hypothetical protein